MVMSGEKKDKRKRDKIDIRAHKEFGDKLMDFWKRLWPHYSTISKIVIN